MAKMLLWVNFEDETLLGKLAEVSKKEAELSDAVRELRKYIEDNSKAVLQETENHPPFKANITTGETKQQYKPKQKNASIEGVRG